MRQRNFQGEFGEAGQARPGRSWVRHEAASALPRWSLVSLVSLLGIACLGGCESSSDVAPVEAAAKPTPAQAAGVADSSNVGTTAAMTSATAGSADAARELIAKLADDKTRSAVVLSLEPSSQDYVTVYGESFGPALEAHFAPMWARREIVPSPWGPDQTQVNLSRASTQDFLAWQDEAKKFPRGYRRLAAFMQPQQVFYQFRFVKPGEAAGANWDGLVWVGGAWKLFPKPWLAAPEGSPFYLEPGATPVG